MTMPLLASPERSAAGRQYHPVMSASAPFSRIRGREAELRELSLALDQVASGRGAAVLIEGEAGIGKTRLLAEAAEEARSRGMQVAVGRAAELERTRPFGPLTAALGCTASSPDPRRSGIAALLAADSMGDLGPITVTSDPGLQFRVVDALADLVEEFSLAAPLLIGVDDLQWADPSSLLALGAVGRRLPYLPVALIGCFRPSPPLAELEQLIGALDAAGARHLTVHSLGQEAVAGLVAKTVAAQPGPRLLAQVAGARGNPLFITELLGALIQEGMVRIADGQAEVAEITLPPSLRLTILRRVSFLPQATLQALRDASILGSGFSITDLATVTGRPATSHSAVLAEAFRAHVLEDDGASLRFRHDLIRDAIYEDIPVSVRRGLHREAGQRLAQAGATAPQVAEHLARGAVPGDVQAIAGLIRAARAEVPRSPQVAADLLERAIALMDVTDPGRDRLLAERASSLMWAGHITTAKQICHALLQRADTDGADGPARLCLGYALVAQSQHRDALPELERAAESPVLTDAERGGARAWAGYARLSIADLDGASDTASQALSATPDHLATSVAMATQALVTVHRRHPADALKIIDEAISRADQSPGRQGHRFPIHATRGFILTELDRLDDATATLDCGRQIGEELGIRWHLSNYQVIGAVTRFFAGEWDDAIAEVEAARELAAETGESFSLILAHCVLSLICVHRNDLGRAEDAVSAAMSQLGEPGPRYRGLWAMWAHARLLEAQGKPPEASALLGDCWDRCAQLGLTLDYRAFGPDLVRLALAGGDQARARNVAAAMAEAASQHSVPSLTSAALHCQGLAENDATALAAAAASCARGSRPLELAQASEDAGAAFARQGEADQARHLLEQAAAIYERLRAARDLARAEATMRKAGIRRGSRGSRSRPLTGWHSLTPTEQTVVALVAEGLTNPQIGNRLYISRRTVQTHLAHVFAKLDITSRAQLAAEATRRRGTAGDQLAHIGGARRAVI
jgi:DNA-binding CsgD family transcriptional regulator/tetratricopeptide (TPR) repeat protein